MNMIPAHMISEETILDLLRRVAALEAEVAALRAERQPEPKPEPEPEDDLIELPVASARFGISKSVLERMCRDGLIGQKPQGRWYVSVSRLRELRPHLRGFRRI